jgi:hypothetical protein
VNNHPQACSRIDYWSIRAQRPGATTPPGLASPQDLQPFSKYARELRHAQNASGKRGLILGSTRQTVDWCRENGLRVALMDFSEPSAGRILSAHRDWDDLDILIDDWLSTGEPDGSFCWAAGDGVVAASGSGREARRLFRQIQRLLIPGSIVILRHFVRPDPTPCASEIFARLEAGKIYSFSALRIRLAQALQGSFKDGIYTRDVCRVLDENGMLDEHCIERFGWDRSNVTALDSWKVEGVSLCYPTLEELRDLAHPFFQELEVHYGTYEMAELCPTIVYRTRI